MIVHTISIIHVNKFVLLFVLSFFYLMKIISCVLKANSSESYEFLAASCWIFFPAFYQIKSLSVTSNLPIKIQTLL